MSTGASRVGTGDGSDSYFDDYVDDDDGDEDDEEDDNDSKADIYDAGDIDEKSFQVGVGDANWCIAGSAAKVCINDRLHPLTHLKQQHRDVAACSVGWLLKYKEPTSA